jgi:2'-phosphotransferase
MEDGVQFFISSNNVILTEGLEGTLASVYFKRVIKKDGTLIQTSPV